MRQLVWLLYYGIFSFFLINLAPPVPARAQELTLRTDGKSKLQVVPAENDAFVAVRTTDLLNNTLQPARGAAPYGFIKENVKENLRIGVFRYIGEHDLPIQSYYFADLGVTEKVKLFDFLYGPENEVLVPYQVKKDLHFRKITLANFQ